MHGTAGWLLRQWGQADLVRQVDQTPIPYSPDREWFTLAHHGETDASPRTARGSSDGECQREVHSGETGRLHAVEGRRDREIGRVRRGREPTGRAAAPPSKTFHYTFIVFPPGESTIGSADDEPERKKDEVRHPVRLTRPFALLDREITFEELIAFHPKYAGFMQQYDAKPEDAGFGADWYDAVGFCRWLGQQMGLAESDQPYADPATLDKEQYPREPDPSASWAPRNWPLELGRRGFRLPTEAEWEVAESSRRAHGLRLRKRRKPAGPFRLVLGEQRQARPRPAGTSSRPTRSVRPAWEPLGVDARLVRGLRYEAVQRIRWGRTRARTACTRGGGWDDVAAHCRSAYRDTDDPTHPHAR